MTAATSRHSIPYDKGTFLQFLGVLLQLSLNKKPNMEWSWRWPAHLPKRNKPNMSKVMREIVFKKYWTSMCVPGILNMPPGEEPIEDSNSPTYRCMLEFIEMCNSTWQAAWSPGDYLVCDESMVFWEGTGEVHVSFQGRKPTQYGIEFKDMACGAAKVMLNIELAEGKEKDA